MSRRARSAAFALLSTAIVASFGCDGGIVPATQVMVILDASDELVARASRLVVSVHDVDGELVHRTDAALGTEIDLPANVPVVPRGGDASRAFDLSAVLLDDSDATLSRVSTREGFVEDTLREVMLTFPDVLTYDTDPGLSAAVDEFRANGIGVNAIPGTRLSVAPDAGRQTLVLASMQLRSPGGISGIYVELVVDGEVRARGQSSTYLGQSVQLTTVVEGDGDGHDVSLQFRSESDRDYEVSEVRLFAVPMPADADLRVARGSGEFVVDENWARVVELTVTPAYAGDYVVLMGAGMTESPGGSGVQVRLDTPSGQYPRGLTFNFGREPILSLLVARVERLEARDNVFAVAARAATGSAAAAHDPIVVVMRADAFPAVRSVLETTTVTVRDGSSASLSSLALDAESRGSHWLTISDAFASAANGDSNGRIGIVYDRDGAQVAERVQGTIGGEGVSMAHIDVVETSAPTVLGSTLTARDGTLTTTAPETSIVAIRL